jgi:hypothetical protein
MQFGMNIVLSNKLSLRFDPLNYARLGDVKYFLNKFCLGLTFFALYNSVVYYACFTKGDKKEKKLCATYVFHTNSKPTTS